MKKLMISICIVVMCLLSTNAIAGYTDGFVDMDNLEALAADWLDPADMEDFALLAQFWLTDQTPPVPLAWYKMDTTGGDYIYDVNVISGEVHDANTATGNELSPDDGFVIAEHSVNARVDNGMRFDADDEQLINNVLLNDFPEAITIMAWLRPMHNNTVSACWLDKANTSTVPPGGESEIAQLVMFAAKDDTYRVRGRSGSLYMFNLDSGVNVEVDVWRHIAYTWDPNGNQIYVDGELKASGPTPIMGDGFSYPLTIGNASYAGSSFGGMIDELRIYDTVLTEGQIQKIYSDYPPVTTYTLSVTSGANGSGATGSGEYLNEQIVPITAGTPEEFYFFKEWTGDTAYIANPMSASTTVTMPAAAVNVEATYYIPENINTLTVVNGSGGGEIAEGAIVSIVANPPSASDVFTGWSGDIATVAEPNSASTTLIMPGVATTVTANYANNVDMIMGHWPFEEPNGIYTENILNPTDQDRLYVASGMVLADASVPGRVGNSFYYDGSSIDRLENDYLLNEMPFTNELTVMAWVRPMEGNHANGVWWSKHTDYNGGPDFGALRLMCGTDSTLNFRAEWASGPVPVQRVYTLMTAEVNTWYHVALTWDAGGLKIYVDGVLKGQRTDADISMWPPVDPDSNFPFQLGSGWLNSYPFTGTVDELKLFAAALTEQQVLDAYQATPPRTSYTLTVSDGPNGSGATGSGDYFDYASVEIVAGTAETGYTFNKWTVADSNDLAYIDDVLMPTTNVTMPAKALDITCTYKAQ